MSVEAARLLLQTVGDTSLWSAAYRAAESERAAGLFSDPHACRLAGERGRSLAALVAHNNPYSWMVPVRTHLIDGLIDGAVRAGVDVVINLAAGLDTRAYRLQLPPRLQWVEVDTADVLGYKRAILADVEPVCQLRQVEMDLRDLDARRALLQEVCKNAGSAWVLTEGLLIYLQEEEVTSLAADLSATPNLGRWILDMQSRSLQMALQRGLAEVMGDAQVRLGFAPRSGPKFFAERGWQLDGVHSMLRAAQSLQRLPPGWIVPGGDDAASSARRMDAYVCALSVRPTA
jgi:methyltransferase (TIGR00027 family)